MNVQTATTISLASTVGGSAGVLGGTVVDPVGAVGVMAVAVTTSGAANTSALARGLGDVLLTMSSRQALLVTRPGDWGEISDPGAAIVAQAIRTGVLGSVHVVTSISATLMAVNAQVGVTVRLYDGDIATGTIIWAGKILAPTGQSRELIISGLNLVCSNGNDATLIFSAAPAAGNFETLSMTGYTTTLVDPP
jgi:hypothetical protein